MLPKKYRLKHMKEFELLFEQGSFFGGALVNVKLWKIDPDKEPRRELSRDDLKIGFVVSKKVHKSAVKRNRIKRQMREVVRHMLKSGGVDSGYLVAIMAKQDIVGRTYDEIEKSIIDVLRRSGILH